MGSTEHREDRTGEGLARARSSRRDAAGRVKEMGSRPLLRDNLRRSQSSSSTPRAADPSLRRDEPSGNLRPVFERVPHRGPRGDLHVQSSSKSSHLVQRRGDQASRSGGSRARPKHL